MATTIRLTRLGKKKRPFYRLVVLDSRTRRDGAYLANLGYYNPFVEPHEVKLHTDEILHWLGKGATVSETARSLLRAQGVLYQYSLVKAGVSGDEIASRMAVWQESATARDARQADKRAAAAEEVAAACAKAEAEKQQADEAEAASTKDESGEEATAEAATDEAAGEAAPEKAPDAAAGNQEAAGDDATAEDEVDADKASGSDAGES